MTKTAIIAILIVLTAAACTTDNSSNPTAANNSGPQSAVESPSNDEQVAAIENAVMKYFEALRDTRYRARAALSTGAVQEVSLATARTSGPVGDGFKGLATKRLEVISVDDDTAEVDYLGVLDTGQTGKTKYTQVTVELVADRWKVADYFYGREPISERWTRVDVGVAKGGLRLQVFGVYSSDDTSVFVKASNTTRDTYSLYSNSSFIVDGVSYPTPFMSGDFAGEATSYVQIYSERPLQPKAKSIKVQLGLYSPSSQTELPMEMTIRL